jgi:lysophospholipid acyltransferase (LPLAT)-like uncharacterized protein
MKLKHPLAVKLAGLVGAGAICAWMRTLDYKAAYYDPTADPVHPEYCGPKIFVLWHENILFPFYLRGRCDMAILVSQHHDADVLSEAGQRLGFSLVRGSTFRGGSGALRELARKARRLNLVITPDGPRGPRRTFSQGAIWLAMKLQLPLVAMGFGYDRPWRMNSWDRFALPRPFTLARAVVGPSLAIPPDLNRAGIEHHRLRVEKLLNWLTDEAEAWATAGTRMVGEVPVHREPSRAKWGQDEAVRPLPAHQPLSKAG